MVAPASKFPIRIEHLYRTIGRKRVTYMRRLVVGRLNVHLFYRGDGDEDPHDHPWHFWTFPVHDYVEEVYDTNTGERSLLIVEAFKWHFRPGWRAHRVLGQRADAAFPWVKPGKFVTIVWKTPKLREWGFWRKGQWIGWRDYFAGS